MEGGKYGVPLRDRLYAFANIIGDVANMVKQKGWDLVQGIGQLVDRFAPGFGSIISAVGSLFGGLFGKKKTITVDKVIDPIRVAPQSLSYGLGANPASAIFGGRATASGAGFTVQVEYKDGTGEIVVAKVANQIFDESRFEGAFG